MSPHRPLLPFCGAVTRLVPMSDPSSGDAIVVEIRGPGHHDRAERSLPVIEAITALGHEVVVLTDLRPRLADDMRALLDAGATQIRLEGDGLAGDLIGSIEPIPPGPVMVKLSAAATTTIDVSGESAEAAGVRAAIEALPPATGAGG